MLRSNPLTDGGTGVGVFAGIPAFDRNRGLLFIGTGENFYIGPPQVDPTLVPKITPIADSMLAVNFRTGQIVWHTQFTSDDIFLLPTGSPQGQSKDWDASGGPYLLSIPADDCCNSHKKRDILVIGTKQGNAYALDRATGEILWTTILNPPVPQFQGLAGVNTFGATDGETIYLPSHYSKTGIALRLPIRNFVNPNTSGSSIIALRAKDGTILWKKDFPGFTVGPLSLANGVLYHTTMVGTFRALDARNGDTLFEYQNHVSDDPVYNALMGGTSVYKGMVYLATGSTNARLLVGTGPACAAGGVIAFSIDGR